MDSPFTAMVILTAGTGSWFSRLSDTKKGIMSLLVAVTVGFAIGTSTVVQIGLPSRVEALEATVLNHSSRIEEIEEDYIVAQRERDYILHALQWQNCALEVTGNGTNIRNICGDKPTYGFGRE